jgi:hypothetical protein
MLSRISAVRVRRGQGRGRRLALAQMVTRLVLPLPGPQRRQDGAHQRLLMLRSGIGVLAQGSASARGR